MIFSCSIYETPKNGGLQPGNKLPSPPVVPPILAGKKTGGTTGGRYNKGVKISSGKEAKILFSGFAAMKSFHGGTTGRGRVGDN